MLDAAREFTVGAVGCPHPAERARHTLYVRDPDDGGPAVGLCAACHQTMTGLIEDRATREQVHAALLALGWPVEFASRFWQDMQKEVGA